MMPELSTRMAALQAGDAHIIAADLEQEEQIKRANARIVYGLESTVIWINAWNSSKDAPRERLGQRRAILGWYAWQGGRFLMRVGQSSELEGS